MSTPSGSDVLTTRPTPFELPLQSSDYIDDIRDNDGKLAIQLYGSLSDPKIIARRDYVIRAVNSFDDMLAAHEQIIALASGWDENGAIGPKEPLSWESVARLAMDIAQAAKAQAEGRLERHRAAISKAECR